MAGRPLRSPPMSGHTSPSDAASASLAGAGHARAIVLVVERDPNIRELESYFLQQAGYGVEFAADGLGALELARRLRPEIIITEILVPKLDGLALCRAIRQDPDIRHTIVLVFSLLAANGRALEAGADAFLIKPLAEHRLLTTVQELLARHRASDLRRGPQ